MFCRRQSDLFLVLAIKFVLFSTRKKKKKKKKQKQRIDHDVSE